MAIPEPGTQAWENMVDFMRKDMDSGMSYTKIEMAGREAVEKKRECLECGEIFYINEDSTGYCEVCGSANIKHFDFDEELKKYKEGKQSR